MIEYHTFMHRGGKEEYRDNIFLNYGPSLLVLIIFGSKEYSDKANSYEASGSIISSAGGKYFEEISESIYKTVPNGTDYMFLKISDKSIRVERHGEVIPYIVKDGELKLLPNGIFALEDEDRIICATSKFYETLTLPGILADSVTSQNCEEWMDNLVCRISEHNMLSCGNLTAVNFIVRSDS